RVFADPYLDFDEDRVRADRVVAALEALSLPELLEHYWSFSASTPLPMRAGFVRSALRAPLRARRFLDLMAADGVPLPRTRRLLSYRDLAAAADLHFERSRIDPAVVPAEVRRDLRGPTRAGAAVYSAWIATRAGRAALRPIAPEWEATLTKAG